jgi:hypothetical protein
VSTRNQRLAALHTFYRFLALRQPEMLAEAQQVEGYSCQTDCAASDAIPGTRRNRDPLPDLAARWNPRTA